MTREAASGKCVLVQWPSDFTVIELPAVSKRKALGFTLVELLVVIGIIAILVGVILPALANARRAAGTVRCASQLREIGNAFAMYGNEFHEYYPVGKFLSAYSLGSTTYPTSDGQYPFWEDFLSVYVTKMKVGSAAVTIDEQAKAQRTVFWGCPAWDPSFSGTSRLYSGYGMNIFPTFTSEPPAMTGAPATTQWALGLNFIKRNRWTHPAERALAGDCILWELYSGPIATTTYPSQPKMLSTAVLPTQPQTSVDIYRHGKYPPTDATNPNNVSAIGGTIAFNLLYADGHVEKSITEDVAYRAIRMRFPG